MSRFTPQIVLLLLTAVAVLLCGMPAAGTARKPYDGVEVIITRTTVSHGLRRIYATWTSGCCNVKPMRFVFTCNARNEYCHAPMVREYYRINDPKLPRYYQCENYILSRMDEDAEVNDSAVCLESVQ